VIYLALTAAMSLASAAVYWPMLYPRDHPRYVAPSVIADIPNTTFRGGLL
jgi:hypothetical protein